MKRKIVLYVLLFVVAIVQAQTARQFTINLTDDGKANMVCFLAENPTGRAIVGVPGGGYSMLSNTHEGTQAHDWMNQQGISYFVVQYSHRRRRKGYSYSTRLSYPVAHQSSRCRHHGILCRWTSVVRHLYPIRF